MTGLRWVLVCLGLFVGVGQATAAERQGFFIGLGLGAATANFDIDSADDEGDVGYLFELDLGWAFANGFAIGGGFSSNQYAYALQLGGQTVTDLNIGLNTVDVTGYYFLPLSPSWELILRAGLSKTTATVEIGSVKEEDDSVGVHGGFGVEGFVTDGFAIQALFFGRTYGVAFKDTGDKEVSATGLLLGVRWR